MESEIVKSMVRSASAISQASCKNVQVRDGSERDCRGLYTQQVPVVLEIRLCAAPQGRVGYSMVVKPNP